MVNYRDYIVSDHQIMLGKPIIKGTRLTVELILRKLAQGASTADLLKMYPGLSEERIQAVLLYAAELLANEELLTSAA
ncbi:MULTISPECIES: DUF433 domain-containing protein [unclassified Siphonobacter]|uniref:DUF433 domain-containing protein n=1 Tax=unclassified Siphonobacter TaxID=2635712 RepID=UPI000CBE65D5|nr:MULTISPECIES: DUF433 domain-containing protein [unclassified Siphonobacter]MDQ1085976.1 uncharacterized protein (DUF433 family) [Siphonobacter sp. SORGH_AS_1065]PKK38090.1 antitoxin [Siphonobacter sp. SORGH_AS_0500]